MHLDVRLRRSHVLFTVGALLLAAAAGAAYASIPDKNGVFTACRHNETGAVRLIDPSPGTSGPLGRCTPAESQVTWNQQGQPGKDGVSPTVAQLAVGDSHCAAGGAAITDASGTTAYVCNGHDGADGKPFTGSFTSPNGQFSLIVSDTGVVVSGPGAQITLDATGTVTVSAGTVETIANNETLTVSNDRTEKVSGDETVKVNGSKTETVGGNDTVKVGGSTSLTAGNLTLNGVGGCRPVARKGDAVDPSTNLISTGSPSVCVGG
jgi:hypothetical protein